MKTITGLFALATAIGIAAPAQAGPNLVQDRGVTYVASVGGAPRVTSLITSTGAPLWTTVLLGPAGVPPDLTLSLALDKDVLYVTAGSDSISPNIGFVWAIDTTTGSILWLTFLPGGGLYSAATVSKGVLYVAGYAATTPSKTTAVNADTGAVIWSTNIPFPSLSSPGLDKDFVVVTVGGFSPFPYYLIVLDPATGQVVRSTPAP
jgi:outer membrane protein assembly factor BamB